MELCTLVKLECFLSLPAVQLQMRCLVAPAAVAKANLFYSNILSHGEHLLKKRLLAFF